MPKGTKVEKLYSKLKAEGKSKGSAARIAQAATGLALATGKPPKNKMRAMMDGDMSSMKKMMKMRKEK